MKTIGLIGGLTWQSSIEYYRIVNELVSERLGGAHSCKCVMYSVDHEPIAILLDEQDWEGLEEIITDAVNRVELAGADFTVICSNTMHKNADKIQERVSKPILNIVDVVGENIIKSKINTVALLGTESTMKQDFYKGKLKDKYGLSVLVPDNEDQKFINNVIDNELTFGVLDKNSKARFLDTISKLEKLGAEGVILGCTEIPLLIKQEDCKIHVFDTTMLHSVAAVDMAFE